MSATVNMAEEEALCPVCGCLLEEDGAFATVRQPCGCIACRPCATTLLSISLSESAQDPRCMLCHGALPDLAGRGSEGVGAFVDTLPTGAPNAAHQEQVQFLGELPSGALSELGQCIGNGGAGAIFEATLLVNGAQVPVAVKVIHRRTSEDWRRERREVSMASLVSQRCSRVCRVYGYTQQNDALLMVMERCQRSLADRLAELGGRGLPQGELARVAVDLCTSLAQLHACDVVHCDIKPGNCLVRADGTVVLADFGGSKASALTAHAAGPQRLCLGETLTHPCTLAAVRESLRAVDMVRDGVLRVPQPAEGRGGPAYPSR